MAETHEEIVKVWIAPGCIVCDACETDCPEVFEVQEETCIIRPEAAAAPFTRALTPSIITAAEGCPVEVIKFDVEQVEGPEPWAGKEQEQAAGATAAAGHGPAKQAGPPIPEGPPDPKWAGLLSAAHTSGSRSGGGPQIDMRAAKAPAEAVAAALPADAPPDAMEAVMVASGYARPRPSVAERIRARAEGLLAAASVTRRQFNVVLLLAWGAMAATAMTALGALQAFMVPKLIKEAPSTFRAGRLSEYPVDGVYENFKNSHGIWVIRRKGIMFALSTTCTHLGCIPNWQGADSKFKCPCHGSGFRIDGVNFEGPAPRPLERVKIAMDGEFLLVDKSVRFRSELGQWGLDGSQIAI
jgi:cytochrome b6-f complex iron-sulfur subunit